MLLLFGSVMPNESAIGVKTETVAEIKLNSHLFEYLLAVLSPVSFYLSPTLCLF